MAQRSDLKSKADRLPSSAECRFRNLEFWDTKLPAELIHTYISITVTSHEVHDIFIQPIEFMSPSREIILKVMPQNTFDDKSTLIQAMD